MRRNNIRHLCVGGGLALALGAGLFTVAARPAAAASSSSSPLNYTDTTIMQAANEVALYKAELDYFTDLKGKIKGELGGARSWETSVWPQMLAAYKNRPKEYLKVAFLDYLFSLAKVNDYSKLKFHLDFKQGDSGSEPGGTATTLRELLDYFADLKTSRTTAITSAAAAEVAWEQAKDQLADLEANLKEPSQ